MENILVTGANTASLSIMARMIRFWVLCALLSSALGAPALAQTRAIGVEERPTGERVDERRVALVIGNGAYDTGRLRNPVNDAAAMSAALQGAGFEVTLLKDAGYQDIRRAVFSFGGALKRGGVGLFYYAGHGVQVKGANYLIPTNAQITAAEEVEVEGLNVNNVLARMASAGNRLNIVILDACRNNPYGQSYRGARSGLAQTQAPSGTYIAYATAPGQVASDGQGANSPFTEALISAMGRAGLKLEDVFKEVRGQVQTASRGDQVPWTSSSITGDFYFKPRQRGKPKIAPPVTPVASDRDALYWLSVKDSDEAGDFAEYLKQFPDGTFTGLAKRRLAALTPAPVRLEPVERMFVTVRNANVRAAPRVASAKLATLASGTEVFVPGRTADGKWLRVERDGTSLGFIYAPLLKDKEAREAARKQAEEEAERRRLASAATPVGKPKIASPSTPVVGTYSLRPGETFRDCPDCPQMVVVPAGSFMMGSPESEEGRFDWEGPRHRVRIPAPFAVGRFEVTFSEWDACVSDGGCGGYRPKDRGWGRDRRPVIYVNWDDAKHYVSWLSKKTGHGYRLLSEAEWEYVARAGTTTRYHWGDDYRSDRVADGGKTEPVGRYASNRFGLHDVHGNVSEWVEDCWHDSYAGAPADGRPWVSGNCVERVARSGFWMAIGTSSDGVIPVWRNHPEDLRAAARSRYRAEARDNGVGFRVARTLKLR
jgi:formylglycine-generating enzyme required for sulfatase activity